jgi:ABC-type branched-subunit amino acid transport system substrate-binding protein
LSSLSLFLYSCLLTSFSFGSLAKSFPEKLSSNDNTVIRLGVSNALSGPVLNLGKGLNQGSNTYFNRLNSQGGINGRSVELISFDDAYEPSNTVINTKKLIEQQVLALFGYVGTPTSHAIMPMLNISEIPFLLPFTGADFLRSPIHSNIFNLRASYYQEIKAQVDYLVTVKKFKNLALVIQADEFGLAGQRVVGKILNDKQLEITLTARYRRNTDDIEDALIKLSTQPVDAVIFVGTYQPFIRLVNLAHQQELDLVFTSLSFIGSHNLLNKIPDASKIVLSEVVPAPKECSWKLCQKFIADMNNAGYHDLNRVQLEGYLNAFVFSQVAKQCGENLSRQCLLKQFEQFSYQDNSLDINFSNDNHQGLQQVYFSFSKAALK